MRNVEIKRSGDVLTIKVNLKERLGASKSGKSQVIASTDGNATVEGTEGIKLGLNVYVK